MLRLTARGRLVLPLAVLALVAGAVAAYPGLVALGAGLLVVLLASVASVLVAVPLEVERVVEPPRVARLGRCAAVIRLRNASAGAALSLDGTDHVAGRPVEVRVPVLATGEEVELRVPVPTERRGAHVLGPLVLHRRGVAGLVSARSTHGTPATASVVPRVLDVEAPPPGVRRGHVGADERVEHGGTDLVGIREYVPGDDLRRLHWATSARVGSLMVREDADPAQPHLTVVLDDRARAYADDGFEEAVDLAVSLLAGATTSGAPGRLHTWSGSLEREVGSGVAGGSEAPRALGAVLDACAALATVPGSDGDAGPGPLRGHAPDVLVVVTGAAADLAEAALLAERAPHGVVLVVDPAPERVVDVVGTVTVLRGPRADDVAAAWSLVAA